MTRADDGPSLSLAGAVDLTRTGDLWLFRGRTAADRAIQLTTNSPVNHVGMAVVIDDLPPLMWHAEQGRGLTDVWSGNHQRGVQLHDLTAAVTQRRTATANAPGCASSTSGRTPLGGRPLVVRAIHR